jgi:hypothetical protein
MLSPQNVKIHSHINAIQIVHGRPAQALPDTAKSGGVYRQGLGEAAAW